MSEPDFAVQYLNTNHSRTTREWTLLIQTLMVESTIEVYCRTIHIDNNSRFEISRLGLEFLPFNGVTVSSTFKDLVLCGTYNKRRRQYHICNPFTMQWTSLPTSPLLPDSDEEYPAALVCEDCVDYDEGKGKFTYFRNADYRYRVIVVVSARRVYKEITYTDKLVLAVFCSELQQWRKISLVLPTSQPGDPEVVVVNKMLYFRHYFQFGSFDPFEVTPATGDNTSFLAKSLPSPDNLGGNSVMLESEGRLLMVCAFSRDWKVIIEELKPENDKQPVRWEVIRESASFYGNRLNSYFRANIVVGVDPTDCNLVYMYWNVIP